MEGAVAMVCRALEDEAQINAARALAMVARRLPEVRAKEPIMPPSPFLVAVVVDRADGVGAGGSGLKRKIRLLVRFRRIPLPILHHKLIGHYRASKRGNARKRLLSS